MTGREHACSARRPLRVVAVAVAALTGTANAAEPSPAVQHLAEAIGWRTVSPQPPATVDETQFAGFLQFLARTYARTFSTLEFDIVAGYSLLLRWPGSDAGLAPALFDSHYDVVPVEAGTEADWARPPFSGSIGNGYLWGRGALDDKITVIATFEAIEALLAAGFRPDRTLYFSVGHDEEAGGEKGAAGIAAVLRTRGVTFAYMIGEGGLVVDDWPLLPGKSLAMIGLAEKTYLTLALSAAGDGGHSSMPPDDNALVRLSAAVQRLHDNPFDTMLVPPVTDMLDALGPHVGGFRGFLFRHRRALAPVILAGMTRERTGNAMVRTTTAVTMFRAGVKENVVPQSAEAMVNFRLLPGDTDDRVIERVSNIIDDPRISVRAVRYEPTPPVAAIGGPGYTAIRTAVEAVLPSAVVVPGLVIASTDTRHYRDLAEDIYRFHPYRVHIDDTPGIHGTDERIRLEVVDEAVRLSTALIESAAER